VAGIRRDEYISGSTASIDLGELAMSHLARRHVSGVRALWATVAATAALAVLIPTAAVARGTAHAAATPSCSSSQLVNWLDTSPNGTLGTIFYELQFTNLGATCTLRGYPGVSAVSLTGKQLGTPAGRVPGIKINTVTIKRGATIKAALGIVDTGALPASKCRAVTAAGLRVIAPNTTASTVIPFPFSTCSSSGVSSLTIRPVVK
jgi:hypothetical protein